MDYVKEEDGWIFAECPECHMIMKFRKNELQRLSIRYKLYESVECFCGRDDEWIYGVPMEQTATNLLLHILHRHILRLQGMFLIVLLAAQRM